MKWVKRGFHEFSKGTMGNGGQNLYVSANGVLQRIFQYDINGDGYPDLLFANSQSMGERPPVHVYDDIHGSFLSLPTNGPYDAVMADINGDGYDDLIIACQNDGTHSDITSFVYFGSPEGLTEKYHIELPVEDAIGVAAGNFRGNGSKPDIVFLTGAGLRIFPNNKDGIVPFEHIDIPMKADALTAADINGDGFCDLYIKLSDGSGIVLWGSAEGLSPSRSTIVFGSGVASTIAGTTTPGKRAAYRGWKPCIVTLMGKTYLYSGGAEEAIFYHYVNNRFEKAFSLPCGHSVWAVAGDLDGSGNSALALICCQSLSEESADSYVFWYKNGGYSMDDVTVFQTKSAQSAEISFLNKYGKPYLMVAQGGDDRTNDTYSLILSFDSGHNCSLVRKIPSHDAVRIVTGDTRGDGNRQMVVINHQSGHHDGMENISIFLGGPDGYDPDRKIQLTGSGSVEGIMFDHNDNGLVDVLLANCSENATHLHKGSYLYCAKPGGGFYDEPIILPSVRAHGAAVGDFNRDGYLDIALGGCDSHNAITIFYGSPNGIDTKNPTIIRLSPQGEFDEEENRRLISEYGSVRWILAADFNGDGWLDLFVSEILGRHCYILWGGPEGFSPDNKQTLCADGVACANAADLNGDGYLDLILGSHFSFGKSPQGMHESYITIYWGGPNGYQESRKCMLPTYSCNGITIADFNGDGYLDIYGSTYNSGRCRDLLSFVYFGSADGTFHLYNYKPLFNHSGSGCVAGDFNGDGYVDLAIACHKGNGNHCSTSFIYWGGPEGLNESRCTKLPTVGPHGMTTVDPGNIMDRSPEEYYYSEVFELGTKKLKRAYWEATIPGKCYVEISFRHGDSADTTKMCEWSRPYQNGEDLSDLEFCGGYIQYRLTLGSPMSCGTPRVTEVTVEFDD